MKKFGLIILSFIFASGILLAEIDKNEVLATVGNVKITYGELERAYQKNMNRKSFKFPDLPKDSLKSFLNMYIGYKLKVLDAIRKNYHTKEEVLKDLNDNRKILAESYYFDDKLYKPFISKMLERRKTEKRIAIIMVGYNEMSEIDSLTALETIKTALKDIKEGKNFGDVARQYSVDKVSAANGGELDKWITAGTIALGLEDPIYATKKGEIYPEIINTRKAFFIIKVLDEGTRKFAKASHILLSMTPDKNSDSLITIIQTKLSKGAKFEDLAKEFSDDQTTSQNGGSLGEYYCRSTGFERNHKPLLGDFERALFNLKVGEISDKVQSEYGLHIIKLDSLKDINSDDEIADLRSMYRRLYLFNAKERHLDSLSQLNGFLLNENLLKEIVAKIDTLKTNLKSGWEKDVPEKLMKENLFEINKKKYTTKEFVDLLNTNHEFKGYSTNEEGFRKAIKNIVNPITFESVTKDYEKVNAEFDMMMKEFHDGILLFKIEAEEVWNKLKFDTAKAKMFFEKNKDKYKTNLSYDISEIFVMKDSTAKAIYQTLKAGANFDTLASKETQRGGKRESCGRLGILSTETSEQAKLAKTFNPKKGEILEPFKLEKYGYSIVRINEIYPVRQKSFEEAIPDFAAEFQDIRQKEMTKEWIERIKKDIPVTINDQSIKKIFKK